MSTKSEMTVEVTVAWDARVKLSGLEMKEIMKQLAYLNAAEKHIEKRVKALKEVLKSRIIAYRQVAGLPKDASVGMNHSDTVQFVVSHIEQSRLDGDLLKEKMGEEWLAPFKKTIEYDQINMRKRMSPSPGVNVDDLENIEALVSEVHVVEDLSELGVDVLAKGLANMPKDIAF